MAGSLGFPAATRRRLANVPTNQMKKNNATLTITSPALTALWWARK